MPGRIFIVEDVPSNRALLRAQLSCDYFDVVAVGLDGDIVSAALEFKPDLIFLDFTSDPARASDLCHELRGQEDLETVLIVAMTEAGAPDELSAGLDARVDDFMNKPISQSTLVPRVRAMMRAKSLNDEMRMRHETACGLGFGSKQPEQSLASVLSGSVLGSPCSDLEEQNWKRMLAPLSRLELDVAYGQEATVHAARRMQPDLILLRDVLQDGSSGLAALKVILSDPELRRAPVIYICDEADEDTAAVALDIGAQDYLVAGFNETELHARLWAQLRRKRYRDEVRSVIVDGLRMAVRDPLTGLYNRRYALQYMQAIAQKEPPYGQPFSVLMMDLDKFKSVNDRFGHPCGDAVLAEVAARLRENLRGIDLVARMGGEEFLVAMPSTRPEQAHAIAERLRACVAGQKISLENGKFEISLTVSVGVASSASPGIDVQDLIAQADKALYAAKKGGRNTVKVFCAAA